MKRTLLPSVCVLLAIAAFAWGANAEPKPEPKAESKSPAPESFVKASALLEQRCVSCHSGSKPKGSLSLTTLKTASKGGENGPAIVPGKPDESLLLDYDLRRQAEDAEKRWARRCKPEQVTVLRDWIKAGAPWPDGVVLSDKKPLDLNWWSLKPLAVVAPPPTASKWVRTPIDNFILAKLTENKLAPAPEADRRTLIRRLTYDLVIQAYRRRPRLRIDASSPRRHVRRRRMRTWSIGCSPRRATANVGAATGSTWCISAKHTGTTRTRCGRTPGRIATMSLVRSTPTSRTAGLSPSSLPATCLFPSRSAGDRSDRLHRRRSVGFRRPGRTSTKVRSTRRSPAIEFGSRRHGDDHDVDVPQSHGALRSLPQS